MWQYVANLDKMSQSFKSCRATSYTINYSAFIVARHVFSNQLINYLLIGYPVRTENTKPSVTSRGPHFVRFVLCDFGLSIFSVRSG